MAVDISNVTTGVIGGTGNFDKLMSVAKLYLQQEYTSQRITGDKYADAYIAIMNQVLAQSIQFSIQEEQTNRGTELQNAQIGLVEEQTKTQKEQTIFQHQQTKSESAKIADVVDGVPVVGSIGKQKEVYVAQVKAFKDKSYQAAAELLTQTWSVQRSSDSGIAPNIDNGLFDNNVGAAVDALFKQVGIKSNPISDVGSMTARLDGETIIATGTVGIDGDATSLSVIASHSNGNTPLASTYMDESKNFTVIDSEAFASIPKGAFSVIASYRVYGKLRTLRTRLTKP